nr:hypothetical protein [Tanacetum cinerariifolium]
MKLPKKPGDPGKFFIPCGFNKLKCKALANLGANLNLMPLSVWKKLGLPELISTRMTLELANRAICTPAGIARDVFVLVGKFTFPAGFVIVYYESDPRVPLILGRPFLRTARALMDVHGEEMILRDGDERLTLNMRHDTSSYSNQPQKESINLINVFNDSNEDFLEDFFSTNQPSGNPTFSSHPILTSSEVKADIFDPEEGNFDIESDLKEIEYLLHHDPIKDIDSILNDSIDQSDLVDLNNNLVDSMPKMFTDEHALDYSSPLLYDEYDDDLFEVDSDTKNIYDDPFNSKGDKIKESKLLVDELDLPYDFLLPSEYDSFNSEDFPKVEALPSTNSEDKIIYLWINGLGRSRNGRSINNKTTASGDGFEFTLRPGDHVFLKVSPARGVRRFGIKGKLSPRFIGPFEILDRVGEVSYRLALPPQLSHVHDVFYVSLLRGYKYHPLHVITYPLDQIRTDLSYVEEPEAIIDRQDRVMRKKTIPFVKILWRNHPEREAAWETEESIRTSYPHFLP